MKTNILKFYIFTFVFFADFVVFAQGGPGDESDGGDLEGNDPPAAPINGKLFLLALAGVLFALYTFKNYRKQVHQ